MIIKGKSVGGGDRLATHLTRADTNERVLVKELRGVAAEDLRGALLEIEAVSAGTRTTKPFYHASINTEAHERLTDEQRAHAIDTLEEKLGLTGQPRVVVIHEKKGREHCHIVWSRIDLDRMAAISDSHNYRKHEEVARALELEFGHERVQGAHVGRDGAERPKRTPSHAEMLQAERTGISLDEVRAKITELWRSTDSGKDFAAGLAEAGFVLARGDRRDFVVIDPRGGTHSLSRRIEGANAKDVRARMADIDASRLPTVAEAKQIQRDRQRREDGRATEAPKPGSRAAATDAPEAKGFDRSTAEAARATHAVGSGVGAVFDGVASAFESLFGGEEHKPQTPEEHAEHARLQQAAADARAARAAEHEQSQKQGMSPQEKLRQELLREFGRESKDELRRDHEQSRERDRSR